MGPQVMMVAGSRNQNKTRCLNEMAGFPFPGIGAAIDSGVQSITLEKEFGGSSRSRPPSILELHLCKKMLSTHTALWSN
jgi:hypothetical protein